MKLKVLFSNAFIDVLSTACRLALLTSAVYGGGGGQVNQVHTSCGHLLWFFTALFHHFFDNRP